MELHGKNKRGRSLKSDSQAWLSGWVLSLAVHILLLFVLSGIDFGSSGQADSIYDLGIISESDEQGGSDGEFGQMSFEPSGSQATQSVQLSVEPVAVEAQVGDLLAASVPSAGAGLFEPGGAIEAQVEGDVSSFSPGGGGRSSGTVSFFGLTGTGGKFAYVIDKSGSMSGSRLDVARAELIRSIKKLDDSQKFMVIFYSDGYEPMPFTELVEATPENRKKAVDRISDVVARGGTYPLEAVKHAIDSGADTVWLLTDGEFADISVKVREYRATKQVSIHTIAFLNQSGEQQLRKIARENRGKYRFVDRIPSTRRSDNRR